MIHAAALMGGGFFIGILSFLPSLKKALCPFKEIFSCEDMSTVYIKLPETL